MTTNNVKSLNGQIIELQDQNGDFHTWYLQEEGTRLYFGSACNVGLLKEGFMEMLDSRMETIQELVADLGLLINEQANYMSKVKLLGGRHE